MRSRHTESISPPVSSRHADDVDPRVLDHEPRNLLTLALHQVVFRIGWIFKTESVIMPAFLDAIAGAGWLRGCIPTLNRLGQSVPPVFFASSLRAAGRKKLVLAACTILMSVPFLVLSAVWLAIEGQPRVWMPTLFLLLYFFFFSFNGLYHLAFGTVQGKLIRATRRGYLLRKATFWGSIPAMLFALWLLGDWLRRSDGGFGHIFGFVGVSFFLAGLIALFLREPSDDRVRVSVAWRKSLADSYRALRDDRNLRRLVVVAMLFGSSLIIFPHYQALAREKLGGGGTKLMVWVIVQNAAVGLFSLVVGPMADARGTRLTLRLLIFGAAITPLVAIGLSELPPRVGAQWYWVVFVPLAVSPLALRMLVNYTLEICEPADHPRYLSTLSLCAAVPFLLSPLVGQLIDMTSFALVFVSAAVLVVVAGFLTFGLDEPRHRAPPDEVPPLGLVDSE